MIFEAVAQMAGMFEIKPDGGFLDAGPRLNLFIHFKQPLFSQPFLGGFAHFFPEKPPQGLDGDALLFRERRHPPVRLLRQF